MDIHFHFTRRRRSESFPELRACAPAQRSTPPTLQASLPAPRAPLPLPRTNPTFKKHVSLQFYHGHCYVGGDVFLRRREWEELDAWWRRLPRIPQCLLRGGDFLELNPDRPGLLPFGGAKQPFADRSGDGHDHFDFLDQNSRDHRAA